MRKPPHELVIELHLVEELDEPLRAPASPELGMKYLQRATDDLRHRLARVEARVWILEHDLQPPSGRGRTLHRLLRKKASRKGDASAGGKVPIRRRPGACRVD